MARLDRKDAEVYCEGIPTLKLSYGDAARPVTASTLDGGHQEGNQPRGFKLDLGTRLLVTQPSRRQ